MSKKDRNMDTQRVPNRGAMPPNRDANAGIRAATALSLRAQKLTYDEIATRTGFGSASACRKAVLRELDRVVVNNVEELRREESVILDQLHARCMKAALDEGNKGYLFAVDRVLAIRERFARLYGLDANPNDVSSGATIIREYGVGVTDV